MAALTSLRTFRNPGSSPVQGTRIYNRRWYLCTFQNTKYTIGGGRYLAEGEYTKILPGKEARKARDASLNHLNALEEYTGSVWQVLSWDYFAEMPRVVGYFGTEEEAQAVADLEREVHVKWLANLEAALVRRGDPFGRIMPRLIKGRKGCWPITVERVR